MQGIDLGNVVKKSEFHQELGFAYRLQCDNSLPSSYKALRGMRQRVSQGSPRRQSNRVYMETREEIYDRKWSHGYGGEAAKSTKQQGIHGNPERRFMMGSGSRGYGGEAVKSTKFELENQESR